MAEDSDSSICGFDPDSGKWIVAGRSKKKSTRTAGNRSNPKDTTESEPFLTEEMKVKEESFGKKAGDQELQCDVCHSCFSVKSQGVPYSAYHALEDHRSFLSWICDGCKSNLKTSSLGEKPGRMAEAIAAQTDAIKAMSCKCEAALTQLKEDQKALAEVVRRATLQPNDSQKTSVKAGEMNKPTFADIVKGSCDEVITTLSSKIMTMSQRPNGEALEKERRKCNIVVHNLPESPANNRSDAVDSDCRLLVGIFKDVMHLNTRIASCYRVGRRREDGKARMLVASFESEAMKRDVLRLAPELKHSGGWTMLYIHPDLTKSEREEAKALREELQNRRRNGEENLTIRNKKIVVLPGTDDRYQKRQLARQQLNTASSSGETGAYDAYATGAIPKQLFPRTGSTDNQMQTNSTASAVRAEMRGPGVPSRNTPENDKLVFQRECNTAKRHAKTAQY